MFFHVQQLENGIVVRTPDVASIAQRTIGVAYEHFTNSLDDTSITPKRSQGGGNQAALPHTLCSVGSNVRDRKMESVKGYRKNCL